MLKEILEEIGFGKISEATFERIKKMIQNSENDFVIITASRGDYTRKENQKRNTELLQELRKKLNRKDIGAYRLVGHWKECSKELPQGSNISDCSKIGGKIIDSLEDSWFINIPQDIDKKEFEKVIQDLAKKYSQDAYIIRINGKTELKGKDGSSWEIFKNVSGNPDNFVTIGFKSLLRRQGFTQFKKDRDSGKIRSIIFEVFSVGPKNNNMSKMLFSKMGIRY